MRNLRIFLMGSGAITWLLLLGASAYLMLGGVFYAKNTPLFDALLCTEVSRPLYLPINVDGIYLRSSCVRGVYQFRGTAADVATMNSDQKYLDAILNLTSRKETEKMLDFWLSRGANINIQSQETGATLLYLAANTNDVDTVELLLKYGARTDIRDKAGHTALDSLRLHSDKFGEKPNEEIVKLLGG